LSHAGRISTGSVQASDKASSNRVFSGKEHNGRFASSALRGPRCGCVWRYDGYLPTNEVVSHFRNIIVTTFRPAIFNADVLSNLEAALRKSAYESFFVMISFLEETSSPVLDDAKIAPIQLPLPNHTRMAVGALRGAFSSLEGVSRAQEHSAHGAL